jgi:hypothetical protein
MDPSKLQKPKKKKKRRETGVFTLYVPDLQKRMTDSPRIFKVKYR